MNPLPVVRATIRANRLSFFLFLTLIAAAVALGVALTAQERALRRGSARAVDKFDLIVAAPGSQTDVVLSTIFLQPSAIELIPGPSLAKILTEPKATIAAPIAFGDSVQGIPVVGTSARFVSHLADGMAEGRAFATRSEAVVGAAVNLPVGHRFHPTHGHGTAAEEDRSHEHGRELTVVGRMKPTASPWDRAIVVPVEYNWEVHGLPTGHPEGSEAIGAPYNSAMLPGVPAVVLKPESFAAAYGLRNTYRTTESTAFFPAEVLTQLYGIMGDVRQVMSYLTTATQILVILAIIAGVVALMDLYQRQFAVLRAIGASRFFILVTIWSYLGAIVISGTLAGLIAGVGLAYVVSSLLAHETGIVFSPQIGAPELVLAGTVLGLGCLLALIPAVAQFRRPVVQGLKA